MTTLIERVRDEARRGEAAARGDEVVVQDAVPFWGKITSPSRLVLCGNEDEEDEDKDDDEEGNNDDNVEAN